MELTPFETAIKKFLDNYIQQDPDPEFIDKYNNPKKSIAECCKYIMKEVEKSRKSGERCVAVADEEVYGLAIHYYDEEDLVVEETKIKVEVATQKQASSVISQEAKPKARKQKTKKAKSIETEIKVEELDINLPEPLDIPLF